MTLIQNLIDEDFGYEKGGGVWGRSEQHDSLVLNETTQKWFWNSKGIRGGLKEYLTLVRGYTEEKARKFLKDSSMMFTTYADTDETKSPPYEKLVELMWSSGRNNREYWYKRCLNDDTIDKFRLGFFDGWYLIPLYDDGEFHNFQCRRDEPEKRIKKWYANDTPILFNADILDFVSTVYITEGTVDSILLNQLGLPAISQSGTNIWLPSWFGKFSTVKNIFYIEDNDDAGRIASKMISKNLGYDRVKVVTFDGYKDKYDTVDFFRDGKTLEEFLEYVHSTAKFMYELEDVNVKRRTYSRA